MKLRYLTEFPAEYHDIPEEILTMVKEGMLDDTSWHNDVNPSFMFEWGGNDDTVIYVGDGEHHIRIWVSPVDRNQREDPRQARFIVDICGTVFMVAETIEPVMQFVKPIIAAITEYRAQLKKEMEG